MATYKVITLVDIEQMNIDEKGIVKTIIIPSGSIINQIAWDGKADFSPPINTKLEKAA